MKKILSLTLVCVLLLGTLFALTSCSAAPNADPDKAVAALKEAGYIATKGSKIFDMFSVESAESVVAGIKYDKDSDEGGWIVAIYYKDADTANEHWDAMVKLYEKVQQFCSITVDFKESDLVINKSGVMIYFGTKNAVKAAK